MTDWLHGTCPQSAKCAFYQGVVGSPLLRVKYAMMFPYCKGGKHEACMRWWVMERGEPVADDLLPDGGRDVFAGATPCRTPVARGKILVVDDLPMFRKSLVILAGNACDQKCTVIEAESAEAAIDTLRATPSGWDLVVTDYNMGGANGCQLISQMRAQPGLASIPVIVFSSEQDPGVKERCMSIPMVRWLEKKPDQAIFDAAWDELVVRHKP